MNGPHATSDELSQYVMGVLGPAHARRLETHTIECGACAERLAVEARFELAFERVAEHSATSGGLRSMRAVAFGAAGLLAAAAAVLLWVGHASPMPAAAAENAGGEGRAVSGPHSALGDGAILDVRSDVLDGG